MTNILIIVQARMASTRLPGKVLQPLLGQPLLLWHLVRLSQVRTPCTVVVACPATPENDPIAELCARHGYHCERPPVPEANVLARYYLTAHEYSSTHIVRTTADCPLVDAAVIDGLIAYHQAQPREPDYTGLAREWGDGNDCELMTMHALETAHLQAMQTSEREHVSSFLYRNAWRFRIANYPCPFDLSWMKASVDTQEELDDVEYLLLNALRRRGLDFRWNDIWHSTLVYEDIYQRMRERPMNSAYVAQVAQEGTSASWEALRYGHSTSPKESA